MEASMAPIAKESTTEYSRLITTLRDEINILSETLSVLGARTSPVLFPNTPQPAAEPHVVPDKPDFEIGVDLYEAAAAVRANRLKLQSMIDRLAV